MPSKATKSKEPHGRKRQPAKVLQPGTSRVQPQDPSAARNAEGSPGLPSPAVPPAPPLVSPQERALAAQKLRDWAAQESDPSKAEHLSQLASLFEVLNQPKQQVPTDLNRVPPSLNTNSL